MSGSGGRAQAKEAPVLDFGGLGLPAAPVAPPPSKPVPAVAVAPAVPAGTWAGGPATVPAPRVAEARPAAAPPAAVPARAGAPKKRRGRRRTNPADDGTGVSLPIALVGRLRDFCAAGRGRTYTSVTLDAVEATHDRLAGLLAPQLPPGRSGPLFAGRAPRRTTAHGVGHQQVNLRFGAEDLRVLDALAEQVAAPSRSAMLAAALSAYLPDGEAGK